MAGRKSEIGLWKWIGIDCLRMEIAMSEEEALQLPGVDREVLVDTMSGTRNEIVSQIDVHCFDCYHGRYELVTRDEEYPMTDGSRRVLPRVNYLRCMECGEELLTSESDRYIQEYGPPQVDIRALWEEHERKTASDGHRRAATD